MTVATGASTAAMVITNAASAAAVATLGIMSAASIVATGGFAALAAAVWTALSTPITFHSSRRHNRRDCGSVGREDGHIGADPERFRIN